MSDQIQLQFSFEFPPRRIKIVAAKRFSPLLATARMAKMRK